jgi:GT2 family glycosyltransferase
MTTSALATEAAGRQRAQPAITVVIPTAGESPVLGDVLDGLGVQAGVDIASMEVIVVVDGGVHATVEELRAHPCPYRLEVVELLHSGLPAARDAGWRAAHAPLVLFVDDDVVPSDHLVAEHLEAQRVNGPCVVLGRIVPARGRRRPWVAYDDRAMKRKYRRLVRDELPSGIHHGGNVSMPRTLLVEVGGHDHVLQHDADVDLGDRLRARGARFVYHPAAIGAHRGEAHYAEWRRRYSIHGRYDVSLRRASALGGGLSGLLACYYDRHPLNRLAVRVGLGRRSTDTGGLADLLALAGALAYRLRLDGLSYWAFSGAANLLYWSGVRDGMRGNAAFWKAVRAVRHHRGRPYVERRG